MTRTGQRAAPPGDTLDSWKAIATYLNRDVRTAMRWERTRGLPVRRIPGRGKSGVFALKSELDAWWKGFSRLTAQHVPETAPRSTSPSIAVLPFVNLSSDTENAYFSDGLADEIITVLTHVDGLRVTARTSSFAFRGCETDVREIGKKLGVATLLEGSVQRANGRVRVSAQLVDAASGFHVWSELYDRDAGDVFAIEDELSQAIASALEVRLTRPRAAKPTLNQEAYNCWLKGRYYQQSEGLDSYARSRTYLNRAIALDGRFPQPYLGLAAIARVAAETGVISSRQAITEGWAAIREALTLDDSLGEAYALSGAYRAWMDFDWAGASADFRRALELAPASAEALRSHAIHCLVPANRLREAEEQMRRAVELDPVSPLAYIELGKVLLWARQIDRAGAAMEAAFELRPDSWMAEWYRGISSYFGGRAEEAVTIWRAVQKKVGVTPIGTGAIGMVLGQLGRHEEARAMLAELDSAECYVPPLCRAQIHLGLGEIDAAFECLDRSIEARDIHILDLPCKPIWDALRGDPRFAALLRKMRL